MGGIFFAEVGHCFEKQETLSEKQEFLSIKIQILLLTNNFNYYIIVIICDLYFWQALKHKSMRKSFKERENYVSDRKIQ